MRMITQLLLILILLLLTKCVSLKNTIFLIKPLPLKVKYYSELKTIQDITLKIVNSSKEKFKDKDIHLALLDTKHCFGLVKWSPLVYKDRILAISPSCVKKPVLLKGIIAHELGHISKDHMTSSLNNELRADLEGTKFLIKAGYPNHYILLVLYHFVNKAYFGKIWFVKRPLFSSVIASSVNQRLVKRIRALEKFLNNRMKK